MNEYAPQDRTLNLQGIIDFNFFPSLEMDDSWWDSDWLDASIFTRLRKVKAAHRKLSEFILKSYQLKDENYFDFTSCERQAALLGSTNLKTLLYSMGLIIESDAISGAIQREAQQAIKKSLGEADYLYALKNRISVHRVQSSNGKPTANGKACKLTDFKNCVHQSGLRCLLSLLGDMPQGFIQRILFKLPKAWNSISLEDNKGDYREIRSYLPRLLKEVQAS